MIVFFSVAQLVTHSIAVDNQLASLSWGRDSTSAMQWGFQMTVMTDLWLGPWSGMLLLCWDVDVMQLCWHSRQARHSIKGLYCRWCDVMMYILVIWISCVYNINVVNLFRLPYWSMFFYMTYVNVICCLLAPKTDNALEYPADTEIPKFPDHETSRWFVRYFLWHLKGSLRNIPLSINHS